MGKNRKTSDWQEKRVSLGNAIIVGGVLAVIGAFIGINWRNWFPGSLGFLNSETIDQSELDEIYNKLSETYYGEVSQESLIEGAKKGMVSALGDVYTEYMDSSEKSDFSDQLHGNVGAGIGVEMGYRDGYVRVLRILPDNPALRAGIKEGDIFYKVNGEEVYTWDTSKISSVLRGDAGTEVTVTMAREGKELEFKMVREEINNVSWHVKYDGETAILTVIRFDNNTGTEIQKEASSFNEKGIKKVILDLRGNGGGYVAAAQDLLSLWLDNQLMLTQKSSHFGEEKMSTRSGRAILKDMKTVVLINGSTASASEITAAALKEYKKATIVGTKSFGKGVVQKMFNLDNGGMLKVTIAEWLTPNGNSINNEGIDPDIEVDRTAEDIVKMRDPQMDRAKAL